MASPWFRFYTEVLNDPKILRLSDKEFRAWVLMLCIAGENDGQIDTEDLGIRLRMQEQKTTAVYESLISRGLIDQPEPGLAVPHNWNTRQYKSDVSTSRVKRFRERRETVSETPPEADTEQKQIRTDPEADADPPAHPFTLTYVKRFQERRAGQRPSQTEYAAAIALEREFGAGPCIELGNDLNWEKHPNYMRPILKERADGTRQLQAVGRSTGRRQNSGDDIAAAWEDYDRRQREG